MSEAKIKLSVNGAREAKSDLESVGGAFTSMGEKAKATVVGIAAGVGIGTFASMVKGAIDAADNLNDLSKATSISVEQLAGLDLAARQSGGDLDGIAKSINKLSENIGKNAEKFAAIGVTAKEPLEAFKQFADVFKSIEDPQQKAAFGAVALGKAWESAAPLLAEGGDAIAEMVEKGTKLSGMTQQFADESDKFNDSLAEMTTVIGGVAAKMGSDLLPIMNEVVKSLAQTSAEASSAGTSFNPITEVFRVLTVLGGNVAFVFKGVGSEIAGISAQIALLASGDWRGALSIGDMMKEDAAQARESFDKWEANIMNVGKVAKETAKEIATIPLALPGPTVNVSGFIGTDEDTKAAEKAAKAAERAAEKARQEGERASKAKLSFVAALEKEYQSIGKSVEQNKLYEASLLGIKGRQLDLVKSKLASIEAQKKLYEEEERWFALGDKLLAQHNDSIQSMVDNVDALQEQVKAQQEYSDNLGLSKEALAELAAVKLEDAAAGKERNAQMLEEIGLETQQIGILREQADELRKLANLKRQGTAKEAAIDRSSELAAQTKKDFDAMQSESQKFTDSLYNGLSDSLYRGFEAGKGFFQSFWDGIKNLFKTTVLKLAVQGVMTGVLGLGVNGAATAQGLGGGLGSAASALSTGASLWEGFATAGTAAGAFGSTGFMASLAGGLNGAGIGSGLTSSLGLSIGNTIQSVIGNSAAGSLSSGISAISGALGAIPVWGWAALGAAAVAASLGGGKDRVIGNQSVSGTLGTNDLMRNVDWTKDGGWFNSNTAGTWNYNLANSTAQASNGQFYQDTANVANDQKLLTQLNTTYDAIKMASGDYAKALGLNADLIAGRVDKMSFALGKTQEEIDKAIQGMFGTIADDMAKTLIPSIAEMAKEGETASEALGRIATGFGTANAIFTDLQLTLFKVSDVGYKASSVFIDLVGGVDALKAASTSYYENFYTQEERNASIVKSLTAEFEKQALVLPTTRDGYRALVESISQTGTPEQLAALFKLNSAFASVFEATTNLSTASEDAAAALKLQADIAQERAGLQDEYNRLTMTGAQLLDLQKSSLFESNKALFDSINAIKEKTAAEEAAAQSAQRIAQERASLQDQLDQLLMSPAQLLAKQKSQYDPSNQGIFDQLQTATTAKQQADALKGVNDSVQQQINDLIKSTLSLDEVRASELVGLDQSTAALKKRLFALQDESKMTEQLKVQAQARADSFSNLMNSLVSGIGDTAKSFEKLAETMKQARDSLIVGDNSGFDIKDRLALMREQIANATEAELPGLSNEYLSLLKNAGVGGVDYQREFSGIVNRLDAYAINAQSKSIADYSGAAGFGELLAKQKETADFRAQFGAEYGTYAKQIQGVRNEDPQFQINLERGNRLVNLNQTLNTNDAATNKELLEEIKRLRQASEATAAMLSSGVLLVEVAA